MRDINTHSPFISHVTILYFNTPAVMCLPHHLVHNLCLFTFSTRTPNIIILPTSFSKTQPQHCPPFSTRQAHSIEQHPDPLIPTSLLSKHKTLRTARVSSGHQVSNIPTRHKSESFKIKPRRKKNGRNHK